MLDKFTGKSRRQEITEILSHSSGDELSEKERIELGRWFEKRFAALQNKVSDGTGITRNDVIEAYSSAKWGNGTKFLWHDMRMLKSVAAHFDRLALAGAESGTIEPEDIQALQGNARVKRSPEGEVTVDYPTGKFERRTAKGELYRREADGSMSYDNGMVSLGLDNKTGKGQLEMKAAVMRQHGGIGQSDKPLKIDLERRSDGSWWGKDEQGNELQMAIDEHSVRLTMSDMDMLLTSKGGFIRDPSDPNFVVYMNPDGTTTIIENGQSHELAVSESGVQLATDPDGTNYFTYPFDMNMKVNPDKSMDLGPASMLPIPHMTVSASGEVTLLDREGKEVGKGTPDEKGVTTVALPNGLSNVQRAKDGIIKLNLKDPYGGEATITINPNGTITIGSDGSEIEVRPPEIKRPK